MFVSEPKVQDARHIVTCKAQYNININPTVVFFPYLRLLRPVRQQFPLIMKVVSLLDCSLIYQSLSWNCFVLFLSWQHS